MRSRDRAGVCLILRACGLVVDRRALGLALELDLRANLDLSAVFYVRRRGRDLLFRCVKLPEVQRLPGNIAGRIRIAAPVLTVINAQIAGLILTILCRQITISGKRPNTFCRADSHTVVVCGKIQILAAGLDVIAAFCSGDLPSKAVAAAGCQRAALYSNLYCKRLIPFSFAGCGQNPCIIAFCHGNGNGICLLNV